MKKIIFLLLGSALFIGSCSEDPTMPTNSSPSDIRTGTEATMTSLPPNSVNTTKVYFNDALIAVQLHQLNSQDAQAVLPHLTPVNVIYRFVSFADGIEHNSLNFVVGSMGATPYWREVKVVFNTNVVPFQMTSAFQIQSSSDLVTQIPTNTVYHFTTAPDISL